MKQTGIFLRSAVAILAFAGLLHRKNGSVHHRGHIGGIGVSIANETPGFAFLVYGRPKNPA
jgi:hypothetical protein